MDRQLIEYLPPVLRNYREIQAIMDCEQCEIEQAWQGADNALKDGFVSDATANGISRWEKMLRITPKATESLDNRRFTVQTRLAEKAPYTMAVLHRQLKQLCGGDGYELTLQAGTYTLSVLVALSAKINYDDVDQLLKRIVPANIVISLGLKYNQHETLHQFTHAQLGTKTHYEIRNEVLNSWQAIQQTTT